MKRFNVETTIACKSFLSQKKTKNIPKFIQVLINYRKNTFSRIGLHKKSTKKRIELHIFIFLLKFKISDFINFA